MIRIIIEIDEVTKEVKVDTNRQLIPDEQNPISETIRKDRLFKKTEKEKICIVCGKSFVPRGNRQVRCSIACGMKPKSEKEKQNLAPVTIEEVLSEVKESQSKPYEFGK